VNGLSGNKVEEALHNFGLTEKETQIYIFLAKHGAQGGREIASGTKTAKSVVYRKLKSLQRKGFVESSLEYPVRYSAVPFETILDLNIRAKHEEARKMENSKRSLLTDWSKISISEPEYPIEKFAVIEGDSKIFAKIFRMVKETKSQLSTVATVRGLIRADRYGIFEAIYNHPLKSRVKFHIITDLSMSDLRSARFLKRRLKRSIDLRGRNPDLGLRLFPRMIIRDREEALFFITPQGNQTSRQKDETCLWTNCKAMIQAFSAVFEDLWVNSTDIEKKINEIVTGKPAQKIQLLKDPAIAEKIYLETLDSARDEIIIVTSSRGLIELSRKESEFEKWCKKGASVRIMAPITTENLQPTRELLKWSEIRHFPPGYFETTIIDSRHLFQFSNPSSESWNFENTLYTNNIDYIQKTKRILFNIWESTTKPSFRNILSLNGELSTPLESRLNGHYLEKKTSFMQNIQLKVNGIDENNVLSKIEREKKKAEGTVIWSHTVRYFGCRAFAAIRPPERFALPDMIICAFHHEEESAFGSENLIIVNLLHESGERTIYETVAFVQDNPELLAFRKKVFTGSMPESNILTFRKDEVQVQVRGKTMFAGWTRPIPLGSTGYTLPPSCLLFEGYGEAKPGKFINTIPSGRRHEHWYNGFDAFVTFFHPDSKYVGLGTEGFIQTNSLSKPLKTAK
jgi:sugar-specific transcriptional regulator TrmB